MKIFIPHFIFCFFFIANCYAQAPDVNGILYVKTGTGGTGGSWGNALSELSDALKAAKELNVITAGTVKQIWVAGGTYAPGYPGDFASTDIRDKTFLMVTDVKLYGGFAGTETQLSDRNLSLAANKTILTGDIGSGYNAYHVVVASGNAGTAEINGFSIMQGIGGLSTAGTLLVNSNSLPRASGGGMLLYFASLAINNVTLCGNTAVAGGGAYLYYSINTTFNNCIISGNKANASGGGLFIYGSAPVFTNVVIAGNNAGASLGGGVVNSASSNTIFNNSIMYGNNTAFSNLAASTFTASYSIVQGVDADPLFINAPSYTTAPFTNGDYSLTFGSPAINTGNNSLYTGLSAATTDIVGMPRVSNYSSGGIIDMGAIESQYVDQVITVANAVKTYGDADFEPVASASSGLPVILQSSKPNVANPYMDAANGNKWKIDVLNEGQATIFVTQAGDATYAPAITAFTITVNKAILAVAAKNAIKTYDGIAYSGGNGVTYTGFVNNEDATVVTGTPVYTGTSQGAVNAGTGYVITPAGLNAANYTIIYTNGALNINKAALIITANDLTKTYDGLPYSGGNGVTYNGFVNNEDAMVITGTPVYTGTSQGAVNVGTGYLITPGGLNASNYSITYVDGDLDINKAALTITANDLTKTYDGLPYSGGNGVTYNGFVNNEDATVVTGTPVYTGTSQGAVNAGTGYLITPGGLNASNYTITYVDGDLDINKAALTITANDLTKTYDGLPYSGGNGVTYNGFVNSEDATVITGTPVYTGTSQGAVNAGTGYGITPSGLNAANYAITYVDGDLNINKAALTITANDLTKTYNGLPYSGGNGVTYNGFVNNEDATVITGTPVYTGTSQGAVNAGTGYLITPGGLNAANYTITYVDGDLNINKAALTITANDLTKTYNGLPYSGGNGVTYNGFVNNEDATIITGTPVYTGSSQGAVNAGTGYLITPSGLNAANYTITYVDGDLDINKAALTITANDLTKTYDGLPHSGGNGVTYTGFVNNEDATVITGTPVYTGTSQGAVNAGTGYLITPSGLNAANYTITYADGDLDINKAALTITANDLTKTYDGLPYSGGNGVTYNGFVNSEDATIITGTPVYTGSSQGAVNAGTGYLITPSGLNASNYTITYVDGDLDINKAALTITANDLTKTYDGLPYSGGNGVTYTGFVNNEDATVITGTPVYTGSSQGAVNAGTGYLITPSGLNAANYTITYVDGDLDINKAALTITANDLTKTYDGLPHSGGNGVTYNGFVNNEDATVITGTPVYTGTSQGAVNAGTGYLITPGGLNASNYTITYVDGDLNINKAALTITANDLTKTYNGLPYSGGNGVTYNGFVNNEDATVITGTPVYTGTSQGAVNAGTGYLITPSGLNASNYTITYIDGDLDINKAALTITANNNDRCFGNNNPTFTLNYNGWVNGEDITALSSEPTATTNAIVSSPAGIYDITPTGATAANYTITYRNGTFTIHSLPVSTISTAEGAILCGNNASISLTASGAYNFQWLRDNNTITSGNTGTLPVTTTGLYAAIATDGNGCTANTTNSITITKLLPPTVAFSFDTYCTDKEISFTNGSDISTSGAVHYTWSSGDGQTDNNQNARFTYPTAGNYTVTLTATPVECPSLAAISSQDIDVEAPTAGLRLPTVATTAGLATRLTARTLTNADYTWTPATGLSDVSIYDPIATLQSNQEYTIRMNFPSGCITTDTLLINTSTIHDIIGANAFTPNGDGLNDVFKISLRGVKQLLYMKIFDRWGNKIFETKDPNKGWDGRYGGKLSPVATYIWSAEAIDINGRTIIRQGAVTLLQ